MKWNDCNLIAFGFVMGAISAGTLEASLECPSSRREEWPMHLLRSRGSPAHREDVYFRAADFFGGAAFFRELPS